MRIRSVKPEYFQHRMHKKLSTAASLLGSAILNYADDEGRFEAEPTRIRGMLVPFVQGLDDLEKALRELCFEGGVGFLHLYEVDVDGDAMRVGQVLAFERHQVINKRTPSRLPPPPNWVKRDRKWEPFGADSGRATGAVSEDSRDGGGSGAGSENVSEAGAVSEDSRRMDGGERRELGRNEGRNPRVRVGSALPLWRQVEAMEREIAEHVANPSSVYHDKKAATAEKKAELRGLREALENLKSGGGRSTPGERGGELSRG